MFCNAWTSETNYFLHEPLIRLTISSGHSGSFLECKILVYKLLILKLVEYFHLNMLCLQFSIFLTFAAKNIDGTVIYKFKEVKAKFLRLVTFGLRPNSPRSLAFSLFLKSTLGISVLNVFKWKLLIGEIIHKSIPFYRISSR